MKVDFLCRDSILAAPIVLDLALFLDLAQRSGRHGIQDWLSFYFKAPMTNGKTPADHDLFAQLATLESELRSIARESKALEVPPESGFVPHAAARQGSSASR